MVLHGDDISDRDPLSELFAQPLNNAMEAWSQQQSVMEEANWLSRSRSLLLKTCMLDRLQAKSSSIIAWP